MEMEKEKDRLVVEWNWRRGKTVELLNVIGEGGKKWVLNIIGEKGQYVDY